MHPVLENIKQSIKTSTKFGAFFTENPLVAAIKKVLNLNGTDEYFTFSGWSPISTLTNAVYTTDNDDGYVVDFSTFPVTEVGRVGENYHSGNLKTLSFIDECPIQNANVKRVIASDSCIVVPKIVLTGDYRISFWADLTSSVTMRCYGRIEDFTSRGWIQVNGTITWTPGISGSGIGLTSAVTVGAWRKLVFERIGTIGTVYLDGVAIDTRTISNSNCEIDVIGANSTSISSATIANFLVEDISGDTYYQYDNTNDTGSVCIDSGPNGNHGIWTTGGSLGAQMESAVADSQRTYYPPVNRFFSLDNPNDIKYFGDSTGNVTPVGIDESNWI